MPTHYVRIRGFLREYVVGFLSDPSMWEEQLFNDITEAGRKLVYVLLPPTDRGSRIGLCGETFYCEAGRDETRPDTLFVYRVESAERHPPRTLPIKYTAEFNLWTGRENPKLIFDSVIPLLEPVSPLRQMPAPERSTASVALRRFLQDAPESLRSRWRPSVDSQYFDTKKESIENLIRLWRRYRLDRASKTTPRQDLLLRGSVKNLDSIAESDYRDLIALFGLGTLNEFVAAEIQRGEPQYGGVQVFMLLEELSDQPIDATVRAGVWGGMVQGLTATDLRRELHTCAPAFRDIVTRRPAEAAPWRGVLLDITRIVASQTKDRALLDLCDRAARSEESMTEIANWAAALAFQEPRPADSGKFLVLDEIPAVVEANSQILPAGEATTHPPSAIASSVLPTRAGADSEFDRWVLSLRIADPGRIEETWAQLRAELLSVASEAAVAAQRASLDTTLSRLDKAEQLRAKIDAWTKELPAREQLIADRQEALRAYEKCRTVLGDGVADLIRKPLAPQELLEIVELCEDSAFLADLPAWARTRIADVEADWPAEEVRQAWHLILANKAIREQIRLLRERVWVLPEGPMTLRELPRPEPGTSLESHLSMQVEARQQLREALRLVGDDHKEWVKSAWQRGENADALPTLAERLNQLRIRVAPPVYAQILESLAGDEAQSVASVIGALQEFVDLLESAFGDAEGATVDYFNKWLARRANEPRPDGSDAISEEVTVEHNLVDHPTSRAAVAFRAGEEPGQIYGSFAAPLLIVSSRPRDLHLKFVIDVRSKLRDAWSKKWPGPSPTELHISKSRWRRHSDGQGWVHGFTLEVPIRPPTSDTDSVEIAVRLLDAVTQAELAAVRTLRWDNVRPAPRDVTVDWRDGIQPGYVTLHPIGPQRKRQEIENRIRNGSPFAVIAPRRFGKSTLVEYLREFATNEGWIVPDPVVCTHYYASGAFNYDGMWQEISTRLQDVTGSALDRVEGELPYPSAFDHVRAAAARSGNRGVLLLFDEAQLFFPRSSGNILGRRLKDSLERSWSRGDQAGSVPLLMGFIGLETLSSRIGSDLEGLLRPIRDSAIEEVDLNRLIRTVTRGGLQTTREARLAMSKAATDLLIMRSLLEPLAARAKDNGRGWITFDDVGIVEEEIRTQLRDGRETAISKRLRDPFNEAESIDEWKPNSSYPAAIAVARALQDGSREPARLRGTALRLLNQWCRDNFTDIRIPEYDRARFEEHLRRLSEIGVLERDEFRSPLCEAWLSGHSHFAFASEGADRDALFRGAILKIRTPEGAESLDLDGGEAQVLRFADGEQDWVIRKVKLTPGDRERFLESIEMHETLRSGRYKREAGSEYIFELRDIGLAEEDDSVAVQLYRWIQGQSLAHYQSEMPAELVVETGRKLAAAVALLHKNHILHRDIRPKNVILASESLDPVLIDFGLARVDARCSTTIVGGDFSAPEVRCDQPEWSTGADIYALAATLASLIDPSDARKQMLDDSLAAALVNDPTRRPKATELCLIFEDLALELRNQDRRDQIVQDIRSLAGEDWAKGWFREVLQKHQPKFEALELGLHGDPFERAVEMADLLNQVLERFPVEKGTPPLSLGFVRSSEGPRALICDECNFVHSLRTHGAHARQNNKSAILARFGNPDRRRMISTVEGAARRIGQHLGVPRIEKVVSLFMNR